MVNPIFTPMVIAARIHKYFRRFEEAGATEPGNAKTLRSLGLHGGILFNRLVKNSVFIETSPGCYYVVSTNYEKYRIVRKRRAIMVLAGLLIVVFALNMLIFW